MRILPSLACIGIGVVLVSGCADLRVQVDVLNPAVVAAERARIVVERQLAIVCAQRKARSAESAIDKALGLRSLLVRLGVKTSAQDIQSDLQQIGAALDPYCADAGTLLKKVRDERKSAAQHQDGVAECTAADSELMSVAVLIDQWQQLIRASTQSGLAKAQQVGASEKEIAISLGDLITVDSSLRASASAHPVASAPASCWTPKFNEAFGQGRLGSSDIALRMTRSGDFVVKGLMFDPSDTVNAVNKIGRQLVILGAQASGVPILTSQTPAAVTSGQEGTTQSGQALAHSYSALQAYERDALVARNKNDDYVEALGLLSRSLRRERNKLTDAKTDADIERATTALKITFDANKRRLGASDTPPSPPVAAPTPPASPAPAAPATPAPAAPANPAPNAPANPAPNAPTNPAPNAPTNPAPNAPANPAPATPTPATPPSPAPGAASNTPPAAPPDPASPAPVPTDPAPSAGAPAPTPAPAANSATANPATPAQPVPPGSGSTRPPRSPFDFNAACVVSDQKIAAISRGHFVEFRWTVDVILKTDQQPIFLRLGKTDIDGTATFVGVEHSGGMISDIYVSPAERNPNVLFRPGVKQTVVFVARVPSVDFVGEIGDAYSAVQVKFFGNQSEIIACSLEPPQKFQVEQVRALIAKRSP